MRTATALSLGIVMLLAAGCSFAGASAPPTATPTETATSSPTATLTPLPPTATFTPLPPTPTDTPEPPTATPTAFPVPAVFAPIAGRPAWPPDLMMTAVRHGDTSRPVVYLTFDDGYGFSDEVLGILQERRAHATACLVGAFMMKRQDFVRRWIDAGYTLCDHSYTHAHLTRPPASNDNATPGADPVYENVKREITDTQALVQQISPGAVVAPFFRPPYGESNDTVRAAAASLGYRTVMWSLDPQDWRAGLDATNVRDAVVNVAKNGDIIILHFERRSTVDALPFIIDGLRARGFEILGLESLPSDR